MTKTEFRQNFCQREKGSRNLCRRKMGRLEYEFRPPEFNIPRLLLAVRRTGIAPRSGDHRNPTSMGITRRRRTAATFLRYVRPADMSPHGDNTCSRSVSKKILLGFSLGTNPRQGFALFCACRHKIHPLLRFADAKRVWNVIL